MPKCVSLPAGGVDDEAPRTGVCINKVDGSAEQLFLQLGLLLEVNGSPLHLHPDEEKNSKYGEQASEYTKQLLEGKTVKLEFDVEEKDSYGRLLAYVYVDDIMVNKKLLEEGLAQIATYPPNVKYVDEFTKIQEEARENKKGFWAEDVF